MIWAGAPHDPHEYPDRTRAQQRRDRVKAWIAHQPIVHRLLDVALVGALPGIGAYARFFAPHNIEITEHTVPITGLSPSLDGLRVVQLSDLHLGQNMPLSYIRHCIRLANRCRPDIVALTGDFLQWDPGYIEALADLLHDLEAPFGVYAVLGNHDYGLNSPNGHRMLDHATERLVGEMESVGVRVLRNESESVRVDGDDVWMIGVEDLWSGECDPVSAFAGVPDDATRVFLCHNPDGFGYGERYPFHLMLSGHTHGAQIRFPKTPAGLVPVRDPRLLAGFYGRRGSWLYVNRGLGYIWKVRLNSAPEISCHTLRPERFAGERPRSTRHHRERWRP